MCSTYMEYNGRTCQVAFSGFGYNPNLLSKLGIQPEAYSNLVFRLAQTHHEAMRSRNFSQISSAEFLRDAIPVYARAAYFRSVENLDVALRIDSEITAIARDMSPTISGVFQGRSESFTTRWPENSTLSVFRWFEVIRPCPWTCTANHWARYGSICIRTISFRLHLSPMLRP